MNDTERMLTKDEIRYLESATCKDCISFYKPSSELGTEKYDEIGWCPENDVFVFANDPLYESECEAFYPRRR